jgi:hypothetical protein
MAIEQITFPRRDAADRFPAASALAYGLHLITARMKMCRWGAATQFWLTQPASQRQWG